MTRWDNDITVSTIAAMLTDRIEALAADLLPGGRREGHRIRAGSAGGERGDSLSLLLAGPKRGRWEDFASGDHGDPLDLIRIGFGMTEGEAVRWAKAWLGIDGDRPEPRRAPDPPARVEPVDEAQRHARRLALLARSVPLPDTPAETYLAQRGLPLAALAPLLDPAALRFAADCWHWPSRTRMPAMVAPVVGIETNAVQALHLTFLQPDGRGKAAVEMARLFSGPIGGGCIKLVADADVTTGLAIGEGIESSFTAILAGLPAWSLMTAGGVADFPVLPGIEALTVLVDNDPAGIAAADRVAARWREAGRLVRVPRPEAAGRDWNDEVRGAA